MRERGTPIEVDRSRSDPTDLIDKQAFAVALGITIRGLNKLIVRGGVPTPFKIGRHAYWRRATLFAFVQTIERRLPPWRDHH